ncbi:putative N-acetyltransferase HLS1-like [Sesamum angolense]|uniref:N-acetyltransferase HLS1-like n=1 Tax=Sesamum angolense TaxID=2727404 RepID=A0AAE1WL42_9LAMI|nr:putative N-acetyltransferase HLS1-like [Sesamum angolense]
MKIAAETYFPNPPAPEDEQPPVVVRRYDEATDKAAVEELERRCEVGQPGKPSLVTDLMGDPIARVRNFVSHIMLVAEYGDVREIVGVIRGCIKTVTSGKRSSSTQLPVYVKFAYIWTKGFSHTQKCNYVKFRNPTVLVQPVHLHSKPLASDIMIVQVPPQQVELVYRRVFSSSEFFPKDIDRLLSNKLNLGTFVALPKKSVSKWNPKAGEFPPSFAILSIWDTKEVFRLQVKGVSSLTHAACLGTRVLDAMVPWLKIPSVPNVFKNFGFYFMYGLHMEGKDGPRLMKNLCKFVHNTARNDPDCRVVVRRSQTDPVREAIPHWKKFSWDEDIWCIKKLGRVNQNHYDWHKSSSVIFVDPRDL